MIRTLHQSDNKDVMTLLSKDKSYNIFLIGDIEAFGYEEAFQTVYGDIVNGELISVLLVYYDNICFYSSKEFNPEFFTILDKHTFNYISGKPNCLEPFINHYPELKLQEMYFCENKSVAPVQMDSTVNVATTKDEFKDIFHLLKEIEEFGYQNKKAEHYIEQRLEWLNKEKCLYIKQENNVVATLTVTCETAYNAMVIGVATHPNYRKLGLASKMVDAANYEYINNQTKSLCLFYDNPKAGSIYHRLGYETIGKWTMLKRG